MTMRGERSAPAVTATNPSPSAPTGTWTIDRSGSRVSLAWRKHRHWTITGRLRCFGVIHLDELPPVGVVQFEQASGLPVLTMALDPASVQRHDTDLNAVLGGPDDLDVGRQRWWTLHSQSLEILPTGAWRVTAILAANGSPGLAELHLEVDSEASGSDGLVLQGRGVLDPRGIGIAKSVSTPTPQLRLELALCARRVEDPHRDERGTTCTTSMPG